MNAKSIKVGSRIKVNGETVKVDAKGSSKGRSIVYFRNESNEYVWCFESEVK